LHAYPEIIVVANIMDILDALYCKSHTAASGC